MIQDIGRICVKIAGRDAGKKCVVVDVVDETYVLIDGNTRRRKCNISHLEPTNQTLEISKGADHNAVIKAFEGANLDFRAESKSKKSTEKPKKAHISRKKAN